MRVKVFVLFVVAMAMATAAVAATPVVKSALAPQMTTSVVAMPVRAVHLALGAFTPAEENFPRTATTVKRALPLPQAVVLPTTNGRVRPALIGKPKC